MPQFPSREWMEAMSSGLKAHPEAPDVAGVLDGVYRFVVAPGGPLETEHAYDIAIGVAESDADPVIVQVLEQPSDPRVTLTANYLRWKQLITGGLDPMMAVMLRQLRITGDISHLRSGGLASAKPLLDTLKTVDTQWLDNT